MFTRISDTGRARDDRSAVSIGVNGMGMAALLLAGCGPAAAPSADGADGVQIACAIGEETLAPRCSVDQTTTPAGTVLTVRQPDGGFHRLLIATDGRGVVAADGAEAAKVMIVGQDRIEVAIGDARYRLPATVGPVARP